MGRRALRGHCVGTGKPIQCCAGGAILYDNRNAGVFPRKAVIHFPRTVGYAGRAYRARPCHVIFCRFIAIELERIGGSLTVAWRAVQMDVQRGGVGGHFVHHRGDQLAILHFDAERVARCADRAACRCSGERPRAGVNQSDFTARGKGGHRIKV